MSVRRWALVPLLALLSTGAFAAQVTLQWDPNTEPELAGYRLHYGTSPRSYPTTVDVGPATSKTITTLEGGKTYYLAVTAYDRLQNESGYSNEVSYTTPASAETISAPLPPGGPTSLAAGESRTYTAGGAVSSSGDPVQYRFSWSDGTVSEWLPAGTLVAAKSWAAPGVYAEVRVEARCAQHPSVVSPASPPLAVTVGPPGAETVSRPWVPRSAAGATPGAYVYTAGGAVSSAGDPLQYRFHWSDGTVSEWLPVGVIEAAKTWSASGSYTVRAEARCAQHTTVTSDPGDPLAVDIAPSSGETISPPPRPSVPIATRPGLLYAFRTGGAVSSAGDPVEYRLLWGDGTASAWTRAAAGTAVQAWKSWPAEGVFSLIAEARCALHPAITSASAPVEVSIIRGEPLLFFDTFADGTRTGDPHWRVMAGKWSGRAKVLASTSRSSNNWALVDTVPELTAGRISTRLMLTPGAARQNIGIVFAFADGAHYRYLAIRNARLSLGQVGATAAEPAGVKAAARARILPGRWQSLRLDIHPDGEARAYIGRSTRPALTYRFADPAGGRVGVTAKSSIAYFDNFGVWDERVLPP